MFSDNSKLSLKMTLNKNNYSRIRKDLREKQNQAGNQEFPRAGKFPWN